MGCLSIIRIALAICGVIAGIFLISMGIGYYQVDENLQILLDAAKVPKPHTFLVVIGIIILVLSVMSFISAVRNSILGRFIFRIILCALTIVLVVIAILVFTNRNEFFKQSGRIYDTTWHDREKPGASHVLDSINIYLHCCGRNSSADYVEGIPTSCCGRPGGKHCSATKIYQLGCRTALMNYLDDKANWIGWISIIAAILLVLILFSNIGGRK